jgi:hypothetical protein
MWTEHHNRMPVQSIKDLTPSGPREKLTHAQRVDVAKTPVIEITRTRMMTCMITSPVIIRRQGYDADRAADPIVRKTPVEERPVAAVVLDHEESDEQARRGRRRQQPNGHGQRQSTSGPDAKEGHCCDHQLENASRAIGLAIKGEQPRQRAGFRWALNHV